MATLKAFKDAIKEGVQITVVEHWNPKCANTVRTVTKVQGNGYWFIQPGYEQRMWGDFPKASELNFDGRYARITINEKKRWLLDFGPVAVAA